MTSPVDLTEVQRERDLYRAVLDLGNTEEVDAFLERALGIVLHLTGARRGYVELHDERTGAPVSSFALGCSGEHVEAIRSSLSRGVIAEALATGSTISTASALEDPRFSSLGSVRANRIEAVLCAPIGETPPIGVVYLQDRPRPGPFTESDRQRLEQFARDLGAFADRLLMRNRRASEADSTKDLRRDLRVDGVVGRSAALAHVLRQVALLAPLDVSVMITGATGTGKSQIARVIHDNGPRALQPFVEINCAALPEALVESELFGAVPGGHSAALRRVEGKVAAAEGGTLFLDEIGELPLAAQAKLLQLLQSREYYPLGASRSVTADVRIISATNADLTKAVEERKFREDLFYRLHVLPVRVPSLAERREDIPDLLVHLCRRACERHRLPLLRVSSEARRLAEQTDWPGNVRQLANAVEAAVIRAAGEGVPAIEARHLFPGRASASAADDDGPQTFQEAVHEFQRAFLQRTLEAVDWNVSEAAKRLDLARSHVYALIRSHRLERARS